MTARASIQSRLTILVTGFIVRRPVGGLAWHYGQYVAGLRKLGHRVFFMEDSEDFPSCFVPQDRDRGRQKRGQLSLVCRRFGNNFTHLSLFSPNEEWKKLRERVKEGATLASRADGRTHS